jgi:hypothetical protein
MGNITVHSGPPTSLSTHGRFRPIVPLSHPPAPARLPRAARRSLPSGGRLASRRRHRRHPPSLALWLTLAPKRGPRRSWPPSQRAPRPPGASLPSTYTPRSRRYKKPPPPPMALPTLAASGDPVPCPPTRNRRRRRRGREGGARRRPEQHHLPRSRSRPRGGAGPAGATHACDPCFLGFLSTAPSCFPYQRRLLPRHRAAHPLH